MSVISQTQTVIGIVAKNSQEFIEEVFTAFEAGKIVVTLRSDKDKERIEASGVSEIVIPGNTTGWINIPQYKHSLHEDIAQLLFTSGTEGRPKGILLSHQALANTTERLISVMEIDSTIKEYIGVPIYYSFGFGRIRVLNKIGGKAYLPKDGFSPTEIAQMLKDQQINALSAVPTLLRLILQNKELFEACGKQLQWLEIGSQHMSAQEKEQLKDIFPNAKIIQHYGLTEASRTSFLKIHETSGDALDSVGICYGDTELRVTSDNIIQTRGPHVASYALIDGKIQSLLDQDNWLTTSDHGHIIDNYLFFDGRSDDLINCAGVKLSPEMLQAELSQALNVHNAIAITKINDEFRGENILICYLDTPDINIKQLKHEASRILEATGAQLGNTVKYYPIDKFPLTETGKLQRKALTQIYMDSESQAHIINSPEPDEMNSNPTIQKLVDLWEDTLKIKPVSQHDSFFDLGGDSLSAIRISVKMEKMGFPKSACQELFRGKTIAQIASTEQPKPSTQKLVTLWEETLKIKPVSQHDSFFELGGDSLSAIRISVKMEKMGFSKAACQELFRGKTIAQITEGDEKGSNSKKTVLSSASKSIDITRGILVLLVVASHWMPGVMEHLSQQLNEINRYLAPLYSAGTPGFAIIFGVGVGFFNMGRYKSHPDSIVPMVIQNAVLLLTGIAIMGLIRYLALLSTNNDITPVVISNLFWSVLTYYFMAILTLPIWLKIITRFSNETLACLSLATIFFLTHIIIGDIIAPPPSNNPIYQTLILYGTAKYNYFEMSSGAMFGAALGVWFRAYIKSHNNLGATAPIGVLLIIFSIILSHEMGTSGSWFEWPKPLYLWSWVLYLGVIIISINTLFYFIKNDNLSRPVESALNIAATIGTMAFPIFIGHELVLPLKSVLLWINIPFPLTISLLLFFIPTIFYTYKLYHIYYGKSMTINS